MNVSDFDYELPPELIAHYPTEQRGSSRLLCLDSSGKITHQTFSDLPLLLQPNDLLIFNNTRVIRARLYGRKETGGQVEILIERLLDEHRVLAHIKASKSPKVGAIIYLDGDVPVKMLARHDALFELQFLTEDSVLNILDRIGHIPLPPYIARPDEHLDDARYQTVYATTPGAVAAPTAGLHFDTVILQQLQMRGIAHAFVTLHVGAGTFQPVRCEQIADHVMHHEWLEVTHDTVAAIHAAKAKGGRIIAVGTTSVRSLETAAQTGQLKPYCGDTNIFIVPGYKFQIVDAMITNFHLPRSTLLMLVSAFSGHQEIMAAYQEAILQRYRFFSYGDAMLLQLQKTEGRRQRTA